MLPTIARNDPAYPDQHYWRGRVWAPLNFLTYMAMKNHPDMAKVRKDLAQKSDTVLMNEWREHRHIHENYNAITGEGCDSLASDKFYHWGALLGFIALHHGDAF
jgi:glycogen debranching enzyme